MSMPNFKDFINSVEDNAKLLELRSSTTKLASKISGSLVSAPIGLSNYESEKFGSEVSKLAHSDEVLTELSNEIGKPREVETEDEFVERAKSSLVNILRNKLLK